MREGLPDGWVWTTLGEAFKWGSGGTPKSTEPAYYNGDIPWAIIGDLNDSVVTETTGSITEVGLGSSSAKWVEQGSVLIAMYGSIGKLGIAGIPLTTNQAIAFTKPDSIDNKYLFYYLWSRRNDLSSLGKGGTQRNISQTVIKSFPFPLAPLPEQRQIVEAIETQLTRLDAAVAALKRAQANLKRYRASVLKSAVEGRLVPTETVRWRHMEVRDVSTLIRNGISTPPRAEIGIPVLRISAVRPLSLNLDDRRYLPTWQEEYANYAVENGDLLFTRYNGSRDFVGVCAMATGIAGTLLHPDKLIRVKVRRDVLDPAFAEIALNAGHSRAFIDSRIRTTAGQSGISGADIKSTPVPVPPLKEQHHIVSEVRRLLSLVESQERMAQAAMTRAERLRQSILRQAFEGKLVSHDPSDEPASVLLERIRAECRSMLGGPKSRGRASEAQQRLPF